MINHFRRYGMQITAVFSRAYQLPIHYGSSSLDTPAVNQWYLNCVLRNPGNPKATFRRCEVSFYEIVKYNCHRFECTFCFPYLCTVGFVLLLCRSRIIKCYR